MLKLIAIACEKGIKLYDQNNKIIVVPPKRPRNNNNFIFSFFGIVIFFFIKNGSNKNILMKFLKKACSIGWTKFELNLIIEAKIEKNKHEIINKNIGYIFLRYKCLAIYI